MQTNTKDFPIGPPPTYETAQDLNSCNDPENEDGNYFSNKTPDKMEFEDPPPYKEKEFPTGTVNGFQFLFPLITRPWKRFFSLCWRNQWSISAENFGHNMTYYQLNYLWLLLILVVISLLMWVFFDFFKKIYVPLPPVITNLIYRLSFDYLQDWLCRLELLCTVDICFSHLHLCAQCYWMLPHWVVG